MKCLTERIAPIEVARTLSAERALGKPVQRASHRGALPMTQSDYLRLLDWTGRQLRKDKRGAIPWELAPILERSYPRRGPEYTGLPHAVNVVAINSLSLHKVAA